MVVCVGRLNRHLRWWIKKKSTSFKGRGWRIGCPRERLYSTEPRGHRVDAGSPQELESHPMQSLAGSSCRWLWGLSWAGNADGMQVCNQAPSGVSIPYMVCLLVSSESFLVFGSPVAGSLQMAGKALLPYSPNISLLFLFVSNYS